MAVIMAFFHMSMGIICKGLNAIYFKKYKVLFFEVFTGIMVFWGLIGWLVFLIWYKWMFYAVDSYAPFSDNVDESSYMGTKLNMVPSLITTMTALTVSMGQPPMSLNPENRGEGEVAVHFFNGDTEIGSILLIGVVIAVPFMLCAIPCSELCCGAKHGAGHGDGHG